MRREGTDEFYQKGIQKSGTGFLIGTLRPGAPLGIAEGFATAWSAQVASGLPVAMALDTSNLKPLAEAIRQAEPDRALVFFADNDHHLPARPTPLPNAGLEKARAAAEAVGNAVVVAPPARAPTGTITSGHTGWRQPAPSSRPRCAAAPPRQRSATVRIRMRRRGRRRRSGHARTRARPGSLR